MVRIFHFEHFSKKCKKVIFEKHEKHGFRGVRTDGTMVFVTQHTWRVMPRMALHAPLGWRECIQIPIGIHSALLVHTHPGGGPSLGSGSDGPIPQNTSFGVLGRDRCRSKMIAT